jgi:dynein heavy chain
MAVPDQAKLMQKIYEYQEEYNADPRYSGARGKNALKLVLFSDACEHITRIVRVLRQPRGNALLLGVGGSGRQSLAKISAFIANQVVSGIELIKNYGLKAWREDLKRILMTTGL